MNKDKFFIKGLGGEKSLKGKVEINGAKNDVLKAMAASILFKDKVVIKNVPDTEDVKKMFSLLELAGVNISYGKKKDLIISSKTLSNFDLDLDISKSMRASVVATGPILARYGRVSFPAPGGCVIGTRPIDLFIQGYEKMGAKVEIKNNRYCISIPNSGKSKGRLHGAEIFFPIQTVGGTETLMMAAVLARGKTILKNCAMEPEIKSLADYLVSCGAKIKGAGTTTIEIIGGNLLSSKEKPYITLPDRIEAGSFLILGSLCADELYIDKCEPKHLESLTSALLESGVPMTIGKNFIHIKGNGSIENSKFKSFSLRTHEYPGFATDLQAQIAVFQTQATGESVIFETIYESRFKYIQELKKLGAEIIEMNPREILIKGPTKFKSICDRSGVCGVGGADSSCEELEARDIRAGFATIIAALLAKGDSVINNIYFIDRGYENLEKRLSDIGVSITRLK